MKSSSLASLSFGVEGDGGVVLRCLVGGRVPVVGMVVACLLFGWVGKGREGKEQSDGGFAYLRTCALWCFAPSCSVR
jgi:hypothetical protein